MELYQMRFFKAVADNGTLTEAANVVHVTQPSLSRSIKKLEEEYGTLLFDRVGRNLVLNAEGKVFLRAVNYALEAVDAVGPALTSHLNDKNATLNLYAPVPLGEEISLIMRFREMHPEVKIRFAAGITDFFENDSANIYFFASFNRHDEAEIIGEERIVAILPKGHPLESRSSISIRELAGEQFVLVLPCVMRTRIDDVFRKAQITPEVIIEDQKCWNMTRYVASCGCVSIGPDVSWFQEGERERVSCVPIREFKQARILYLRWIGEHPWTDRASLLRDFLVDHFAKLRRDLDKSYASRGLS